MKMRNGNGAEKCKKKSMKLPGVDAEKEEVGGEEKRNKIKLMEEFVYRS
jgi:hypothetical protein